MDKIVPAFETTLFDPTLSDACIDMAELGIDSLLDEGVFKSIPIHKHMLLLAKLTFCPIKWIIRIFPIFFFAP